MKKDLEPLTKEGTSFTFVGYIAVGSFRFTFIQLPTEEMLMLMSRKRSSAWVITNIKVFMDLVFEGKSPVTGRIVRDANYNKNKKNSRLYELARHIPELRPHLAVALL